MIREVKRGLPTISQDILPPVSLIIKRLPSKYGAILKVHVYLRLKFGYSVNHSGDFQPANTCSFLHL
jgi:hypothetical protein